MLIRPAIALAVNTLHMMPIAIVFRGLYDGRALDIQ